MSRKVSGSGGDYSQILSKGAKRNAPNKFPRITRLNFQKLIDSSPRESSRLQSENEKNGDSIFCGVGILAGTYSKKVKAKSSLGHVAAPIIYGQVIFEGSDPAEVSEWMINYDMTAALIEPNADEMQATIHAMETQDGTMQEQDSNESNESGHQIVQQIEDELDKVSIDDLARVSALSEEFVSRFGELTETPCKRLEFPRQCIEAAIDARDDLKCKKFFFCPGDWIFFAPVPPGLSTYRALDDLAQGEVAS